MRNDVDALTGDLVRDGLHARAAHTNASTDRVDARVVAADRYFRTYAWIAGGAQNLNQTLADLGDLELEQLHEEFRGGSGQEQLRAAGLGADFFQEGFDAVLRLDLLAGNHVGARHEPFRITAQIHVDPVAIDAFHDTTDQGADAIAIGIDHLGTLSFAHLLHNDLLGLLGGNATESHRFHRLLHMLTHFDPGVDLAGILEAQLALGHLQLLGVIRKDLPAAEGFIVAALAVDGHARVPFLPVFLTGGRGECGFESLEDHLFIDTLLVRDGVHDHQNFLVHNIVLNSSHAPKRGS